MASTTAEVLLYFGSREPDFRKTVDTLRFVTTPQMTAKEIIDLLKPIYRAGYDEGFSDGYGQCNDGL